MRPTSKRAIYLRWRVDWMIGNARLLRIVDEVAKRRLG